MGEIAVNSGIEMEFRVEKKNDRNIRAEGGRTAAGSSPVVTWERFLPKMVRVMLVEADDSTRQIIAALLRKCSYKVAAVPDGLKAWELLKGRPYSIDLILTEVELPSISGYALLTLIMEHDVCKNIPVIMMSSHDSVSTVYKCMLRGAADFLVKPVRKNELRNLWQHVWRKQASSTGAGLGPPDESVAQEKDEATAENNAVSNHSSGYISSGRRNNQFVEKGSDAQSSCTKPEIDGKAENENHPCISTFQESRKRQVRDDEFRESQVVGRTEADYTGKRAIKNPQDDRLPPVDTNSGNNNNVCENSSKEAIDLIGTFDNHLKGSCGNSSSNGVISKFTAFPPLDLSLRRSHHIGSLSQSNEERPQLNHSNASPFSRYVNKPLQLQQPYSTLPGLCNSETQRPTTDYLKEIPVATVRTQHDREISHPIPVRAVRRDNLVGVYDSVMPSLYSAKSGSPGLASPGTNYHSESFPFYSSDCQPSTSHQFHSLLDQRRRKSMDETENKHGEKPEDQMLVSPGNDHSTNSSYCNGNMSHNPSTDSGSNGKFNAIPIISNEENPLVNLGSSHRSIQREAALTKFRQKRKDRCFEKKVRYESRKKLAEQRPRVKGQFVRQVPNNPQGGDTSGD